MQKDWDLLVGVIESTDRVQHMMWRLIDPKHPLYDAALAAQFGDSIERVYKRADDFVGEVVRRVGPGRPGHDRLGSRLPLVAQGGEPRHLARAERLHGAEGPERGTRSSSDLFGGGTFWENVDWSRTRAYAMGIGQIYFNLRGRESQGIVSPGAEATALADELAQETADDDGSRGRLADHPRRLQARRHLQRAVHHNASELQVGMNEGYRVSWQTTLGGSPPGIVYKNDRKWSADHGGYDFAITSGDPRHEPCDQHAGPAHHRHRSHRAALLWLPMPTDIDGKPLY